MVDRVWKAVTLVGLITVAGLTPAAAWAQVGDPLDAAPPPTTAPPAASPTTSDPPVSSTTSVPAVDEPLTTTPLPAAPVPTSPDGDDATPAMTVPASEAAPANDAFTDAQVLSGPSGTVAGSTLDATVEPNEPDHGGGGPSSGGSVWYQWTAPATGPIAFDTCESDFDSLLGIYTGTSVDALTVVVQDDDGCGVALGGIATFDATAGTTYAIAVDGFFGAQGAFTLVWGPPPPPPPPPTPPANDRFADAEVISGLSGEVTGTNVGAAKEPGEPDHAGVPGGGGASVWYAWVAPAGGEAVFDTCTADFDTLLGVYTGTSLDDLALVAGNDDDCASGDFPTLQSAVTFAATAGTTYWIAVDGFGVEPQLPVETGTFTLAWALDAVPPPPPPPPPGPDIPELARTGADLLPTTGFGLMLLGLGAALVLMSRRIRRAR